VARSHASIAILPFTNLTGDPAKDYLGEGLAEELTNTLTRAPGWFKVAARRSAFAYKGRHIDVRQIAHALSVETVLEGSVLCCGESIRITAQLVDGQTGHHLWSRSYEREFVNWVELQSELIVSIADALIPGGSGLSAAERKPPTRNLRAFQFFLQARSLNTQPSEHNHRSALEFLSRAIELDSAFARAWQGMAVTRGFHFVTMDYPMQDALIDAERAAQRALALDDSLAGSRAVLGFINACRGQWIKAEAEIRESLAARPNDPEVQLVHSIYVAQSAGHLRKASEVAEAASRLTPLTPVYTFYVGIAKARVGRYTEAREWIRRSIVDGMPETAGPVSEALAHLAQQEYRYEEALGHMMNGLSPAWRAAGGIDATRLFYTALAQPPTHAAAVAALQRLEAGLKAAASSQIDCKRLIMWYTNLGALDSAYAAADRTLQHYAPSGMVGTAWGILWIDEMRPFRQDPRFQTFVEQLGLMEYWTQYGPPDHCELRGGRLVCS
jgi:TolB-like protein/tetratricopeptide (TPR) repeat protein